MVTDFQLRVVIAAVIFAILAGTHTYAWFSGKANGMEKYYELKSEVDAAQKQIAADNERKLTEARANTEVVAHAYADWIANIDGNYRSRLERVLRESRGNQATGTLVTKAAAGTDERSANCGPNTAALEGACQQLERDAAKTTLMFYGLRDYVNGLCKTWGCE